MQIKISKTTLEEIELLRALFLTENAFQFTYNKCHQYGWSNDYVILIDGTTAGYGCLWGKERSAVFEFYLTEPFRKFADIIFTEFYIFTKASLIECQSNDMLLTTMLFRFAENINSESILFEEHQQSNLTIEGAVFGKTETVSNNPDEVDGYYIQHNGEVVATGGFMLNYNKPYADIYMEVKEGYRKKGFGSLIVQELKKEIYAIGRVPAARCNIENPASKATLLKAGFKPCGFRLKGDIIKK